MSENTQLSQALLLVNEIVEMFDSSRMKPVIKKSDILPSPSNNSINVVSEHYQPSFNNGMFGSYIVGYDAMPIYPLPLSLENCSSNNLISLLMYHPSFNDKNINAFKSIKDLCDRIIKL